MAPVRLPGQAKAAFEKHGVTDFVVDSDAELDKLLAETGNPKKLRIFVRLVAQLGGALLEMSSKYGCRPEEAAKLLKRVRAAGAQPCLTFHVGSQCLSPFSYAQAIEIAQRTIDLVGRGDRGAGYRRRLSRRLCRPGAAALSLVFRHDQGSAGQLWTGPNLQCDVRAGPRPGARQGISLVTQVVMRRGDRLYLNDGIYGSFDEQRFASFDEDYPPTAHHAWTPRARPSC